MSAGTRSPNRKRPLGLVTAIFPDQTLAEVSHIAAAAGYDCLEIMCWPPGSGEARRYAGVCHLDVTRPVTAADLAPVTENGLFVSGLGYYGNPLSHIEEEAAVTRRHMDRMLFACKELQLPFSTFVGRDRFAGMDENRRKFLDFWPAFMQCADELGVPVCIENCPMYFTADQWPAGLNLACTPAFLRWMFAHITSPNFRLEFDPAHFVWQQISQERVLPEFYSRIGRIHAKDARLDRRRLEEVGALAFPLDYHTPRLPGEGDVDWDLFFLQLDAANYRGPVVVEVEDKAYEGSLEDRITAIRRSREFLDRYLAAP